MPSDRNVDSRPSEVDEVIVDTRPTGTPYENLGCPHCGATCDVCEDLDDEVNRLREALRAIAEYRHNVGRSGPAVGQAAFARGVLHGPKVPENERQALRQLIAWAKAHGYGSGLSQCLLDRLEERQQ